jgi:predicted  nucleic acid-binding Zn-ribbon protein
VHQEIKIKMNEFTKRELEIIRKLINNLDEKMLTSSQEIILIQSKIQSMIDNYCKHEKIRELISQDDYIKQCEHCGEILEWS